LLFVTSRDGSTKQHTHIAYIREDGTGTTSVDNKHVHEIIFNPPVEALLDPLTQEVLSEATEGFPSIVEADGHSHLITEPFETIQKELFKIPIDDEAKDKSIKRVKALFLEGRKIEQDSFKIAEKAEEYYEGKQWKEEHKSDLEAKDRAAITVNEIEGKLDLLSGVQRQGRLDIRFFPTENGDNRVADILTIVVKNVMNRARFDVHESSVYEDQTITGRGLYRTDTDFDEDIRGKIITEKFDWRSATFGPHEELDGSDADYNTKQKWLALAKLKQMFPEKAKDIERDLLELEAKLHATSDTITVQEERDPYNPNTAHNQPAGLDNKEFADIKKREFRLIESWQKVYKQVHIAMNAFDGFFESLEGVESKEISRIKSIDGMDVIARVIFQFRVTKIASNTLLEDEFPDLPLIQNKQFFDITPVYAKKRGNRYWGKVRGLMGLQDEINKRTSQEIDILNRVAPYGWIYDDKTFPTKSEEANFKKAASTPGFFIKVDNMQNKPDLVTGINYPAEMATSRIQASAKMKEISNINLELLGQQGKNLSGVAIKENKRSGLIGNDFLFDNLSSARRTVALKIVANIQKHWDVERIIRIVGFEAIQNPEETQIGGQEVPQAPEGQPEMQLQDNPDMQAIIRILEEDDLTTYDVAVSESPQTPTAMIGNFQIMAELATQGVGIAPQTLIRMAPIPDKDKAIQELQEFTQAQQQQEDKKLQVELEKTRMAQEGRGGVQQ